MSRQQVLESLDSCSDASKKTAENLTEAGAIQIRRMHFDFGSKLGIAARVSVGDSSVAKAVAIDADASHDFVGKATLLAKYLVAEEVRIRGLL